MWAHHPTTRNLRNLARNLQLAREVMAEFRPDLVVSTGAGVALPFFIAAWLNRVPRAYVEVYDRLDSRTLTGRLCRPITNVFMVQWPEQAALPGRIGNRTAAVRRETSCVRHRWHRPSPIRPAGGWVDRWAGAERGRDVLIQHGTSQAGDGRSIRLLPDLPRHERGACHRSGGGLPRRTRNDHGGGDARARSLSSSPVAPTWASMSTIIKCCSPARLAKRGQIALVEDEDALHHHLDVSRKDPFAYRLAAVDADIHLAVRRFQELVDPLLAGSGDLVTPPTAPLHRRGGPLGEHAPGTDAGFGARSLSRSAN